jgi:hypothetical protein
MSTIFVGKDFRVVLLMNLLQCTESSGKLVEFIYT